LSRRRAPQAARNDLFQSCAGLFHRSGHRWLNFVVRVAMILTPGFGMTPVEIRPANPRLRDFTLKYFQNNKSHEVSGT
jgi:hypothetical protein